MQDQTTLEHEANAFRREITQLEAQVKSIKDYITAQERNLRGAAESVRSITERSLAEARTELHLKELRLQQLRQDLQSKQVYLNKLAEIRRKQQDVETLERERDRVEGMLQRAQADLQQLQADYRGLVPAAPPVDGTLVFTGGERFVLPADRPQLLVGCAEPGIAPDVDLTPLGGTASGVSRRHANLRFAAGGWTITDLNSTNGTFVNGTKIAPHVPVPLVDGSRLRFGSLEASLQLLSPTGTKTTRLP